MTLNMIKDKGSIAFSNTTILVQSAIDTFLLTNIGSGVITGTVNMPSGFKIKDPSSGLWVSSLVFTLHAFIEDNTGDAILDNTGEEIWGQG